MYHGNLVGVREVRIENVERLSPLHVRADVEIDGNWSKNALIVKRKGHYAIVVLEGARNREIPMPNSLDDQLEPYFGP
jgi:hypothetical protein